MPQDKRKLTRSIRERSESTGEPYTAAREGVLATLTLPEHERQAHAFAAAVALRMTHAGENEATARTSVTEIREIAEGYGYTFAEAQAGYDDPRNKVMCTTCGWTNGMVCPECPGCGCYNGQCTGWRHNEFMDDDERRARNECPDCGGDSTNHYDCRCNED